jgi:hypothetical protein
LRVIESRTNVRTMASSITHVWWARNVISSITFIAATHMSLATSRKWLRLEMPRR